MGRGRCINQLRSTSLDGFLDSIERFTLDLSSSVLLENKGSGNHSSLRAEGSASSAQTSALPYGFRFREYRKGDLCQDEPKRGREYQERSKMSNKCSFFSSQIQLDEDIGANPECSNKQNT